MNLSNEIISFAAGNTDYYVAFQDFYFNKASRTAENNEKLQNAFFAEIETKSGVKREGLSTEAWMSHPSVRWATFSVIDATVSAILPRILSDAFGLFTDMRFISIGDIMKFRVLPSQLFTVSLGGRGERTVHRQKDFAEDVIINPIEHIITVFVDMYRVMAGKESIVDFMPRVVLAIEQAMYGDALKALSAGLAAIPGGDLNVTGAFDMGKLVKMAETVEVKNAGVRPIIAGSASALMKVLPDSSLGFRGNYDANGGAIELIKNVYGYDVIRMANAQGADGSLVLADDLIYVVSPAQDKLVKGAVSNSLTNSNQFYQNADITSDFTMRKCWDFVMASSAYAGIYKITD